MIHIFSADKFSRLVLTDLQARIRRRYPSVCVAASSKPSSAACPPALNPASFLTMDNLLKITVLAIKDPHALTFSALLFTVQTVTSKIRTMMTSESAQAIGRLRPNRYANQIQPIDNGSGDEDKLAAMELEAFFVTQLGYTPQWTRSTIIPFVLDRLRETDSEHKFRQNEFFATLGFQSLLILSQAAKFSPHRRLWMLRKRSKAAFFVNRDLSFSSSQRQIVPTVQAPELQAIRRCQDIAPTLHSDSPATLQGVRRLFREPVMDPISGISKLWAPAIKRCEKFRLIFSIVQILHFSDGSVAVEKQKCVQEKFDVLRDIRCLFQPPAGDEVLEDLAALFREPKARNGFKQKLKNSWNSLRSKLCGKSGQVDDCEVKKAGVVDGWKRFKALVTIKRV